MSIRDPLTGRIDSDRAFAFVRSQMRTQSPSEFIRSVNLVPEIRYPTRREAEEHPELLDELEDTPHPWQT